MVDPRPAISFPDPFAAVFDRAMTAALAQLPPLPHLQSRCRLISAVSGGPDSIALALHSQRFAVAHGGTHRSIVIDHGIRPGSDAEAARVVSRLEAHGISASCIRIQTPAPSTGIQEWARHQRFAALTKQARQQRAVLLFAHHQADQAETVLMRLARGSGIAGLAGMRGLTYRDAVPVARPLLNWSADQLRDVLALLGCDFEDDPSNRNYDFERVRLRRFLRKSAACGFPTIATAQRLGQAMAAISDNARAKALRPMAPGGVSRSKWMPSTMASVLKSSLEPLQSSTAQSSPGPVKTDESAGRS